MLKKFKNFVLRRIWNKDLNKLSKSKRLYYKTLKIVWVSIYNFFKHHLILRASALTYFSLMAIVPFFALIFAVAKNIGYQEKIETDLMERFQEQKEILDKVFEFSKNLIVEAKGGLIALVGIIFLFWSLIRLFANLEISMNEVWNVKISRNYRRRISNYLALMFVIPVFTVLFISLKIYVLAFISKEIIGLSFLQMLIRHLPYFLLLVLFTFVYFFMPKAKVKFKYAFYAGFISSVIYQIVQVVYVNFQVVLTRFNAIYGSFAALPLFLIWLQTSWLIFLLGAELSYAFQNVDNIAINDVRKKTF